MSNKIRAVIVLLSFTLVFPASAIIIAPTGTIAGVVTDSQTGDPIANANLKFTSPFIGEANVASQPNGTYSFTTDFCGTPSINLEVTATDYEIKNFSNVSIPCFQTTPFDIQLEPEDVEPDPIILLPGLVGSWNFDMMISPILSDNWRFPPGNNSYPNLVEALVDVGYSTSTNLFIGFYDWRQPNADSVAEYLIPIIDEALLKSGKDNVDIVAHSMGGLVARSYIQSGNYRSDVDQLVLLGVPNQGASDAYLINPQ